jgi:predicted esterase
MVLIQFLLVISFHLLVLVEIADSVTRQEAEKLFGLFKKAGAKVTLNWQESGHELTIGDFREQRNGCSLF